jgi:hypothetical protein
MKHTVPVVLNFKNYFLISPFFSDIVTYYLCYYLNIR